MILLKINILDTGAWKDRVGVVVWKNTDVTWVDAEALYVSHEGFADAHYWDDYLASLDSPRFDLAKVFGGYCKMTFGTFVLKHDTFTDSGGWPPPTSFEAVYYYTPSDEDNLEVLFSGTAYRVGMDREAVTYEIYPREFDVDLLLTETDYESETVHLPRAFGHVKHVTPVRLADVGGAPTYHKGYMPGTTIPKAVSVVAQVAGTTLRATATGHGFSNDDNILLEGTLGDSAGVPYDYDGVYVISNVDTDTFDFDVSAATTPGPYNSGAWVADPAAGHALDNDSIGDYLRVFDDGVPIPGKVTDNGDGTFSLSAMPFSVTMSGYGEDTTLSEIMDWACNAGRINVSYDSTKGRATSPDCHHWADTNRVLIEFLSELASWWSHLYYIDYDTATLYLVDMKLANGTRSLTTGDAFASNYPRESPYASITAKWKKRTRAVDQGSGKYVTEQDQKTTRASSYAFGDEVEIQPMSDVRSDIEGALDDILDIVNSAGAVIPLPLIGSLPVPGEQITYVDDTLGEDISAVIKVRNLRFDFDDETVFCEGEGSIT